MNINRRIFIKNTAAQLSGLAAIPVIISASVPDAEKRNKNLIKALKTNDVVLFQGDSITDAGRDKKILAENKIYAFGSGYALIAASELMRKYPGKNLKLFNRGISGHKVYQLIDRWKEDCIDLKPSLLSILIGVNDFAHRLNNRFDGTVERYENEYRELLNTTLSELPNVKLVICEPFAVKGGSSINEKWFPDFIEYQKVAKKIALEFNAVFIPFQKMFDEALKFAPASYWAPDGVHPSMPGASLMAQAWLKAVGSK